MSEQKPLKIKEATVLSAIIGGLIGGPAGALIGGLIGLVIDNDKGKDGDII